jgi:bifunctional ADP-heptose synthase (sugar kinase/adenylyltransferase)
MENFEPKVIIIGEKAIDIFEYVDINRVNPEAPSLIGVPVGMDVKGGMAENVYNNLISLGLKQNNVCFISNLTAIIKKRFIDKKSNYVVFRIDQNDDIISKQHEYFCGDTFKKLEEILINHKTIKFIVISDYNKQFIDEYWIEQISILAKKYGILTALDSKKILSDWSKEIDFVKINKKEYENNLLSNKFPESFCKNLLVTDGDKGIHWINKGLTFIGERVEVRDVVGAGDVALAAFVIKMIESENNIEESIKFANKAASISVTKKGTCSIKRNEIL